MAALGLRRFPWPAAAGHPGHRQAAAPAVRAGGRIVFVTQSDELALANPDGSHLARASSAV